MFRYSFFFFQAEDGIRDYKVTGVQTCALPIYIRLRVGLLAGAAELAVAQADVGHGVEGGRRVEARRGDGELDLGEGGAGGDPLAHGGAEAGAGDVFQHGEGGTAAVGNHFPVPDAEVGVRVGVAEGSGLGERMGEGVEV